MAITAGASTTSTSGTISKPAGLADGDVLVVSAFSTSDAGVPTAPAGWTVITAFNFSATYYFAVWYRVVPVAASEPATYSFSHIVVIGLTAFTGVDPTTPVDTTVSQSGEFSGVLPAITTVTPGAWIIASITHAGADPINPPAGMTEQWEVVGSANADLATEARPTAGDTGSRTFSSAGGTILGGWMTALRPASSVTPLAGSWVGSGQIAAPAIRETHPLGGPLPGSGTLGGTLAVWRPLAGLLVGDGVLTGDLIIVAPLTGTLAGAGVLTGTLDAILVLAGVLAGSGQITAALQVLAPLTGAVAGQGALAAATLTETHPLAGVLAGTGHFVAGFAPVPVADHVVVLAGGLAPVIGTRHPPQYLGNRTLTRK